MSDQQKKSASANPTTIDPYSRSEESFLEPPRGFLVTLKHLGPGMILVGSVVGSGELIMTTKLGAEAGFALLWFVLLSCVIKVVVQAELARHTISSGRTFLDVFNSLPGPKGRRPIWLNLEWMLVVIVLVFGGLGAYTFLGELSDTTTGDSDSLASRYRLDFVLPVLVVMGCLLWALWIRFRANDPNSNTARDVVGSGERPDLNWFTWLWLATVLMMFVNGGAILGGAAQALELAFPGLLGEGGSKYWAIAVAVLSASVLLSGSYVTLERVSVGLVAIFTVITVICTVLLQWTGFAITPDDIQRGLAFDIPLPFTAALVLTALGMYAGTGIGTGEMSSYTYWCVEKGYARSVGARVDGTEWPRRAKGWVRVMYKDVFLTMIVYTVSTICFYFLGAAVLNPSGLNPEGPETLSILAKIYTETLGSWASTLFVVGGFFVLFSTVLSGVAGGTRTLADGLCVMRIIDPRDYPARLRFIRIFVVASLSLHVTTYAMFENPPLMLIISSFVSVALYPVIGLGTLYLRYREVDPRIVPGRLTTFWLWVCGIALAIISPGAAVLAWAIDQGWVSFAGE